MHEQPGSSEAQGPAAAPTGAADPLFALTQPYPSAEPPKAAAPAAAPARPKPRSLGRLVVLPLLIFVVMVGGITWVVQYLPSKGPKTTSKAGGPKKPAAVEFRETQAVWDPKNPEAVAELEYRTNGQYDFPFKNVADGPAELGLLRANCTCSRVEYCLLPAEEFAAYQKRRQAVGPPYKGVEPGGKFHDMPKSETTGIEVPAGYGGVVRLHWEGRKSEREALRLTADFWSQPKGTPTERSYEPRLFAAVAYVPPVLHFPETNQVPLLLTYRDAVSTEFFLWSATRDKLDLTVKERPPDPCFVCVTTPLDKADCVTLQNSLVKAGIDTKVRCGFRLRVTVHETKDGKQMDMGPFRQRLGVHLAGEAQEYYGPTVVGAVRGDVLVGAAEDQGKVNLQSFSGPAGVRKKVRIWSDKGVELELVRHEPAFLQVKLEKDMENATDSRTPWWLTVGVRGGAFSGPLPQDCAIVLRTLTTPPRQVNIPVLGNAGR
jgi:hypothetical protein